MPQGKKYKAAAATYDIDTLYSSTDAITKVKAMASAKFDETIELPFVWASTHAKPNKPFAEPSHCHQAPARPCA